MAERQGWHHRSAWLLAVIAVAALGLPLHVAHGQNAPTTPGWQNIERMLQAKGGGQQLAAVQPAPLPGSGDKGSATGWQDVAQQLMQRNVGTAAKPQPIDLATAFATLKQQLATQRFGATWNSPAGKLGFVDLRADQTQIVGDNPLLFQQFGGRGVSVPPLVVAPRSRLAIDFSHADRDTLSLLADSRQFNAYVDHRQASQGHVSFTADSTLKLTLGYSQLSVDRKGLLPDTQDAASRAWGLLLGFSGNGDFHQGHTDLYGGNIALSLFQDRWKVKSAIAFSSFTPQVANEDWFLGNDPLGVMRGRPKNASATFGEFSGMVWQGDDGKLETFGHWQRIDADFVGGGYQFAPGSTDWQIGLRSKWKYFTLDYADHGHSDATYGSRSTDQRLNAGFNLSWINLTVGHQQTRNASAFSFLNYTQPTQPGPLDPNDPLYPPPTLTQIQNTSLAQGNNLNLRLGEGDWSVNVNWSGNQSSYSSGSNAASLSTSSYLTANGSYDFGALGVNFSFLNTNQRQDQASNFNESRKLEYGVSLSYSFDKDGHSYGGPNQLGRGYGAMPYVPGAANAPYGQPPLVPGMVDPRLTNQAAPAATAKSGVGKAPTAPADNWWDVLLPSSVHIGFTQGHAAQSSSGTVNTGYPYYTFDFRAPVGPYRAIDGGITWRGGAGQTDITARYTMADGDAATPGAAGGTSLAFEASQSWADKNFNLNASFDAAISRFAPGATETSDSYMSLSLNAAYRLPWLTVNGRVSGVRQHTVYSNDQAPLASNYFSAEMTADVTLDSFLFDLPASDANAKQALPYLRLRGFVARQFPVYSYSGYSGNAQGFLLVGGARF